MCGPPWRNRLLCEYVALKMILSSDIPEEERDYIRIHPGGRDRMSRLHARDKGVFTTTKGLRP